MFQRQIPPMPTPLHNTPIPIIKRDIHCPTSKKPTKQKGGAGDDTSAKKTLVFTLETTFDDFHSDGLTDFQVGSDGIYFVECFDAEALIEAGPKCIKPDVYIQW